MHKVRVYIYIFVHYDRLTVLVSSFHDPLWTYVSFFPFSYFWENLGRVSPIILTIPEPARRKYQQCLTGQHIYTYYIISQPYRGSQFQIKVTKVSGLTCHIAPQDILAPLTTYPIISSYLPSLSSFNFISWSYSIILALPDIPPSHHFLPACYVAFNVIGRFHLLMSFFSWNQMLV